MVTFHSPKSENKTKKCLTQSHTIAFNKGANFAKKTMIFCIKMLAAIKLREPWY